MPDGIIARQLVQLFCGRMGTALHLILAVFYAGNPAQVVLAYTGALLAAAGTCWYNVANGKREAGIQGCILTQGIIT